MKNIFLKRLMAIALMVCIILPTSVFAAASQPVVQTNSATAIGTTTATFNGYITANNGYTITESGFYYGTSSGSLANNVVVTAGSDGRTLTKVITGLTPNTTYYYKAYAKNSQGTGSGSILSFKTAAIPNPTISGFNSSDSNMNIGDTFTFAGTVSGNGGTLTTVTVNIHGPDNQTISNQVFTKSDINSTSYSLSNIPSIKTGTGYMTQAGVYWIRIWAKNSGMTSGIQLAEKQITLSVALTAPTVTTKAVGVRTSTSAELIGNLDKNGGDPISDYGFYLYDANGIKISTESVGSGLLNGEFRKTVSGLSPATAYSYKAYAKNSKGTATGSSVAFGTNNDKPSVTTKTAENVGADSAVLVGSVDRNNGAAITRYGFYLYNSSGTLLDTIVAGTSTIAGEYRQTRTGLIASTAYSYKAFAENSLGNTTASSVPFTTTAAPNPILSGFDATASNMNIGDTFTFAGAVSGNGGTITTVTVNIHGPDDQTISNQVFTKSDINSTSYNLSNIPSIKTGTGYMTKAGVYWIRVWAKNSGMSGGIQLAEKKITLIDTSSKVTSLIITPLSAAAGSSFTFDVFTNLFTDEVTIEMDGIEIGNVTEYTTEGLQRHFVFTRAIQNTGTRNVAAYAWNSNVKNTLSGYYKSTTVAVSVNPNKLNAPSITYPSNTAALNRGEDIIVKWNQPTGTSPESYSILLRKYNESAYIIQTDTTAREYTIPADKVLSDGTYFITVIAKKINWAASDEVTVAVSIATPATPTIMSVECNNLNLVVNESIGFSGYANNATSKVIVKVNDSETDEIKSYPYALTYNSSGRYFGFVFTPKTIGTKIIKVYASNVTGTNTLYKSFTINVSSKKVSAPAITSPGMNFSMNINTELGIAWNTPSNTTPDSYSIRIRKNDTNTDVYTKELQATSYTIPASVFTKAGNYLFIIIANKQGWAPSDLNYTSFKVVDQNASPEMIITPGSAIVNSPFNFSIQSQIKLQSAFLQFDDPVNGGWVSESFFENNTLYKFDVSNPVMTVGNNYGYFINGLRINTPGRADNSFKRQVRVVYRDMNGTKLTSKAFEFVVTKPLDPKAESVNAANIGATTATLKGRLLNSDGLVTKRYYFAVYDFNQNPISCPQSYAEYNAADKTFTANVSGLCPDTSYYFQAFAVTQEDKLLYADNMVLFKTSAVSVPKIKTQAATDITGVSAVLHATVTDNGGADIKECGFVLYWGEYKTVYAQFDKSTNSFSCNVPYLTPGYTYCVHSFATNTKAGGRGEDLTDVPFTTKSAGLVFNTPFNDGVRFDIGAKVNLSLQVLGTNYSNTKITIYDKSYAQGGRNVISTYDCGTVAVPQYDWDTKNMAGGAYYIVAELSLKDGTKEYAERRIVLDVPVTSITCIPDTINMNLGETKSINYVILPANATNQRIAKWVSDNPAVAAISDGKVTGGAAGTAKITVISQNGSKVGTCVVNVINSFDSKESLPIDTIPSLSLTAGMPAVSDGKENINLNPLNLTCDFNFFDAVKAKFDYKEKTVELTFGEFESMDKNEVYQKVKEMLKYINVKPNKEIYDMYNSFVKKRQGNFLFEGNVTFFGYAKFSLKPDGSFGTLIEQGAGLMVSGKFVAQTPNVIYVKGTLGFDANGKLGFKITPDAKNKISLSGIIELEIKGELGTGVGAEFAHVEAGISTKIKTTIEFVPVVVKMSGNFSIYGEFKALCFEGRWEKELTNWQLPICGQSLGGTNQSRGPDILQMQMSDKNSVKLISREYTQKDSIFSANGLNQYENKNLNSAANNGDSQDTVIKTNVFPYGEPEILEIGGGKKILVWIEDNTTRTSANRTALMYSIFDGSSWSIPTYVNDDGKGDFSPSIIKVGESVFIAWQKATRIFDDSVTLEEMAKYMDVYVAKLEGDRFGNIVNLTADTTDIYDSSPIIATNGNVVSAIWVRNSDNDFNCVNGTNAIYSSTYSNGKWSEKKVMIGSLPLITGIDLKYEQGNPIIAYSTDEDKDMTTLGDQNIYLFRDGGITKFTGSTAANTSPQLINHNDKLDLYWYSNDNIFYSEGLNSASIKQIDLNGLYSRKFKVMANAVDHRVILLNVPEQFYSEFYCIYYDKTNLSWSSPIKSSAYNKKIKGETGYLDDNNNINLAFDLTEVLENANDSSISIYGQTNLMVSTLMPNCNLAVDPVATYEQNNVVPGSSLPINLYLTNKGNSTIESIVIKISDVNNQLLKTDIIPIKLMAGENTFVGTNYILPISFTRHSIKLTVTPYNVQDSDLSDNTAEAVIGYADVAIQNVNVTEAGLKRIISLEVKNVGYADAPDINVKLINDTVDGLVASTQKVDILKPGESQIISFTVDISNFAFSQGGDSKYFYISAETNNEEASQTNNDALACIANPYMAEPLGISDGELKSNILSFRIANYRSSDISGKLVIEITENSQSIFEVSKDITIGAMSENEMQIDLSDAVYPNGCVINISVLDIDQKVISNSLSLISEQVGTITGKILLQGRTNLSGVNVSVSGTTISATTDQTGAFTLQGVSEGACTLIITKAGYLIKKVSVTVTNGNISDIGTVTLKVGDANNDNKVDLVDLGILASCYRTTLGSQGYNASADFNNDGTVDLVDLGFLASNYRMSGD